MSDWRPIETAPDDDDAFFLAGGWSIGRRKWICESMCGKFLREARARISAGMTSALDNGLWHTHWTDNPEPPEQSK